MPRTKAVSPNYDHGRTHLAAAFRGRWRNLTTAMAALALTLTGCGTDFGSLLYTSFQAASRAALDQALTDFAGTLAGGSTTDTTGDGTDTTGDGTDTTGDGGATDGTAAGEAVFADSGCTACHCVDATGGCALSAPSLVAVDAAVLADVVSGALSHPVGVDLTDQESADLIAWLASL